MFVSVNKETCYDTNVFVKKGTLLIANDSEFDLTEGRIYVATRNQGEGTFSDCIFVIDDRGIEQDYTGEFFCLYEGELVTSN